MRHKNSADPDQTPVNTASDRVSIICLQSVFFFFNLNKNGYSSKQPLNGSELFHVIEWEVPFGLNELS